MTKRARTPGRDGAAGSWRNPSSLLAVAAILGVHIVACAAPQPPIEDAPLETVDIAGDPDFAPDEDPRAAPRPAQLAGSLPSDFPEDLPLALPASVDGLEPDGRRYRVSFTTTSSGEALRASLAAKLASRGWRGEVAFGDSTLTKAGRTVRLTIEPARFGSRYSYSYE